jgi:uncharacterized protein YciI
MAKRFVYFYLMKNQPDRISLVVPSHVEYWRDSGAAGYLRGPFVNRSGGFIIFEKRGLEEAVELTMGDPFVLEDLLADRWVKEWVVE